LTRPSARRRPPRSDLRLPLCPGYHRLNFSPYGCQRFHPYRRLGFRIGIFGCGRARDRAGGQAQGWDHGRVYVPCFPDLGLQSLCRVTQPQIVCPIDLAAGYHVSDLLIQRAIEVDHKQGISSKFLAYMQKLDSKVGSTGEFRLSSSLSPRMPSRHPTMSMFHA
jgi:hypothetical protein